MSHATFEIDVGKMIETATLPLAIYEAEAWYEDNGTTFAKTKFAVF